MWKVTSTIDTPEMRQVAEVAEAIFNDPKRSAQADEEAVQEFGRQYFLGLPPSEGMPDIRPNWPRYNGNSI